jgi:hypothetical protein
MSGVCFYLLFENKGGNWSNTETYTLDEDAILCGVLRIDCEEMFPSRLLSLVTPRDTIFLPFGRDYYSVSNPVPFREVAVVVNEQPVAVLPIRGWLGDLKG